MKALLVFARLASAAALLLGASAFAQNDDYKREVFSGFGWASSNRFKIFDDTSRDGPYFIGGIGYRPFSRSADRGIGFEFTTAVFHYSNDFPGGGGFEQRRVFLTGNVLYHFLGGRVQPFVVLGLGLVHVSARTESPLAGGGSRVSDASEAEAAGNLGVGAKIFLRPNFSLRPEYRGFGHGLLSGVATLSASIGYHW